MSPSTQKRKSITLETKLMIIIDATNGTNNSEDREHMEFLDQPSYEFFKKTGLTSGRAFTNSNGSINCSTNCTLGVETVLFFRVNEFSNVVFSKFIAQQKMNKIARDHI